MDEEYATFLYGQAMRMEREAWMDWTKAQEQRRESAEWVLKCKLRPAIPLRSPSGGTSGSGGGTTSAG
jgi:hypothetical protein